MLQPGENVIAGLYQPEMYERDMEGTWYHRDNIQPTLDAFLLGDFGVEGLKIVAPPKQLTAEPWEHQGMRYYSGGVTYTVTLDLPSKPTGPVWLEVDCRENVFEVIKGRSKPGHADHLPVPRRRDRRGGPRK